MVLAVVVIVRLNGKDGGDKSLVGITRQDGPPVQVAEPGASSQTGVRRGAPAKSRTDSPDAKQESPDPATGRPQPTTRDPRPKPPSLDDLLPRIPGLPAAPKEAGPKRPVPAPPAEDAPPDRRPPEPKRGGRARAEEEPPPAKKGPSREVQGLIDDLRVKDARTKVAALNELRSKGEEAEPAAEAIINCLLDPSEKVVLAAVETIEKVRPDLYKSLSNLVLDESPYERERAAVQLGALGGKAAPAKTLLVTLLRTAMANLDGPDPRDFFPARGKLSDIRVVTLVQAIRKIDPDDPEPIKALKELAKDLGDETAYRRSVRAGIAPDNALLSLHKWAGDDEGRRKELLPLLKAALDRESLDALLLALKICADYGELAKGMSETIRKLKLHKEEQVRDAAKKALDRIKGQ